MFSLTIQIRWNTHSDTENVIVAKNSCDATAMLSWNVHETFGD